MKVSKKKWHSWRAYCKYLLTKFPDKDLKWLISVYHPGHMKEWESFQKKPKHFL